MFRGFRWLAPFSLGALALICATAGTQGFWSNVAPMPNSLADAPAATGPDGKIYLMCGRTVENSPQGGDHLLQVYDPNTNSWSVGNPPSDGHLNARAVTGPDGRIYLMGGYYRDTTVEVYDTQTAAWSGRASMPTGRMNFEIAVGQDGKIYTFGGDTGGGGETVATVEVYDPSTDTWSSRNPMPLGRANGGAVLGPDGRIYLIGGGNAFVPGIFLSRTDVYDPATDTWTTAADIPTPRSNLGVVKGADGMIYALGGESLALGPGVTLVEQFDPVSNTWTSPLPPMLTPRFVFGCVLGPDRRIYAFGGYTGPNAQTTATVEVFAADTTPPTATAQTVVTGGGTIYVPIRLQDAGSGVAQAQLMGSSTNCRLEWDGPSGTITVPIGGTISNSPAAADTTVRAVKLNTALRATVVLRVTDAAGNFTQLDPVVANLEVKQSRTVIRTFNNLSDTEHFLDLRNGSPGLTSVKIRVNDRRAASTSLSDGQVLRLDIRQWMRKGSHNTVRFEAAGPQGATAVLAVGDASLTAPALTPAGVNVEFAP